MNEHEIVTLNEKDGEKTVTLADLAGLDISDVEAKRFFRAPKGVYVWEICMDEQDNLPPGVRAINGKAAMVMPLKIINVIALKDPDYSGTGTDLIGKIHRETQFITQEESLKYIKAFLQDIGLSGNGRLNDLLAGAVGLKFQAPIAHQVDKNDTSKVYSRIDQGKIIPASKMAA